MAWSEAARKAAAEARRLKAQGKWSARGQARSKFAPGSIDEIDIKNRHALAVDLKRIRNQMKTNPNALKDYKNQLAVSGAAKSTALRNMALKGKLKLPKSKRKLAARLMKLKRDKTSYGKD